MRDLALYLFAAYCTSSANAVLLGGQQNQLNGDYLSQTETGELDGTVTPDIDPTVDRSSADILKIEPTKADQVPTDPSDVDHTLAQTGRAVYPLCNYEALRERIANLRDRMTDLSAQMEANQVRLTGYLAKAELAQPPTPSADPEPAEMANTPDGPQPCGDTADPDDVAPEEGLPALPDIITTRPQGFQIPKDDVVSHASDASGEESITVLDDNGDSVVYLVARDAANDLESPVDEPETIIEDLEDGTKMITTRQKTVDAEGNDAMMETIKYQAADGTEARPEEVKYTKLETQDMASAIQTIADPPENE